MSKRAIAVAGLTSWLAVGCLIDFEGYQTAPPDASAQIGGSDSGPGGEGGNAEASLGGAGGIAGSGGGLAGAGGLGGIAGSGGVAAGAGGAQGGSSGSSGESGQAGTGGTTSCGFDFCNLQSKTPPDTCTACNDYVCNALGLKSCCNQSWTFECVIAARSESTCGCPGMGCGSTLPPPGLGTCAASLAGGCNPVAATGCGTGQCVLNLEGQPKAECQLIGTQAACDKCAPTSGQNCQAGLSCIAGRCVRVCCVTEDCPTGTVCNMAVLLGPVGLCTTG